jgi:hypothetical protein
VFLSAHHTLARCGAAIVLALSAASIASAQSILDATRVEFTPSTDNAAVDSSGVPLVTNYSMSIYLAGGTAVVETVDLGKPAADADGFIRVDFMSLLSVALTPGTSYEATVSSVGPGGSSASARTNTFGLSAPCSYSISPSTQMFNAPAATGSFAVSTAATCQWTAASQSSWISVTAGASATGPGTVSYSVAANPVTSTRTGTILAAGWNFTVTQAAAAPTSPTPPPPPPPPPSPTPSPTCTYTLSSSSDTIASAATSIGVGVTDGTTCTWSAASPVSWAVVSAGASGTGPGTVTVTVSKNNNMSSRSATLTIAGQSFVLTQQGRKRHGG